MTSDVELSIITAAISPPGTHAPLKFSSSRLLELAEFHRTVPHVHRFLRRAGHDVPAALQDAARSNASHNLSLFAHTCCVMDSLRADGIDAVALKGPVLAHQLYGDLGMRVCTDVDVLVPRAQVTRAAILLRDVGYEPGIPADEVAVRKHLRREHDLQFEHADGTLLELHADIAQPHYSYRVDLTRWFQAAVDVHVAGRSVRTLAPNHSAILAIIHGTKHVWSRLDLVADFAGFANLDVDWRAVAAEVRGIGAQRAAAVGAKLAADLTGWSPVPGLADAVAHRIAQKVRLRLEQGAQPSYWQARAFDLRIRERNSDRLRYVARLGLKLPV